MNKANDQSAAPLPRLPQREIRSHKGDYGRVLLVGGSPGMSGAIALAGKSALRGGAGLVTLAVPELIQPIVAALDPCYMTVGLWADDNGHLVPASMSTMPAEMLDALDAMAVGPGLGCTNETAGLVSNWYGKVAKPMVVDADGLNSLARQPQCLTAPGGPRILTPHPGEFVRLALALDPDWDEALAARAENDEQRSHAATWLARHDHTGQTVIVLKGHRTVVADGNQVAFNTTGNPGMATGGSGDVLTGLIAALVGQGLTGWDAARLGAHVHGLAGDLAAQCVGQTSLVATDIIDQLPSAFNQLE